jgi:DNA-binding GntR family transcriptional regulator
MALSELDNSSRNMTVHSYVLSELRRAILGGTLAGGTRLRQAALASQLNVSITPVREALRDLATEGLIEFDPYRGSWVRGFDLAKVQELYQLRILLEPVMVRRVMARVTTELFDRADALRQQMERTNDLSVWTELNRDFHATFFDDDKNSRLAQILTGLRDSASAYVGLSLANSPDGIEESNVEHAMFVRLYRQSDVEGVVELTVQHLRSTIAKIEDAYQHGLI